MGKQINRSKNKTAVRRLKSHVQNRLTGTTTLPKSGAYTQRPTVTQELEESCKIKGNMGFNFSAGAELKVELFHLMAIECFIDQYLTALNMSLLELVYGKDHWAKLARKFEQNPS